MSFDLFVHDRLVAVRLRSLDAETSRAITRLVLGHHDRLGEPLIFVMIIGTDCPMPGPDARRQLAADQTRLHDCCCDARAVVLGRELRQSLVRSLVAGFAMLPGSVRPRIHGSIAEFLEQLEQGAELDPCWLRGRMIEAGLLSPREARWLPESQLAT
jgi:hypothetical protein